MAQPGQPTPTVTELLLRRERDHNPGLLFEDQRWTWAEVVAESANRAALLKSLRRPGPFHVGLLLDNVPEFAFLLGGAALAGAVVVGLNTTRRGEALARDITLADCHGTAGTAGAGVAMGRFIASFDGYDGPEKDESKGAPPAFQMPDFANMSAEEGRGFRGWTRTARCSCATSSAGRRGMCRTTKRRRGSGTRIVVAVGEGSEGQLPNRAGRRIAEELGQAPAVFPGDHQGFGTHTQAWAEAVGEALRG